MTMRGMTWGRLGAALAAVGLVAACGPAAAPPAPTAAASKPAATSAPAAQPTTAPAAASKPAAASNAEWDAIVAAAKQEGEVHISVHLGPGYERFANRMVEEVGKLGIKVVPTLMKPSDYAPRVLVEQQNQQFLWDAHIGAVSNVYTVLTPAKALEPIKPYVDALPAESRDNSKWAGGFELYTDPANPVTLITQMNESGGIYVNRELIGDEKIDSPEALLDPKWKGKIVIYDPTVSNAGSMSLASMLATNGDDFVRKLVFEQEARYVETSRDATQYIAQGRYPIGIGMDETLLTDLKNQGVGTKVERVKDFATYTLAYGFSVLKSPPHPNATKVLLNWFVSQPAQDLWAELSTEDANTRRLDVKVYHPQARPDYDNMAKYTVIQGTATGDPILKKTLEITKSR